MTHRTYGRRNDAIVGYTFNTEQFCPRCIIAKLPTGEGEAYDGWALAEGITMSAEANLDEIAAAFQIDRLNEHTFDSTDFPKVITDAQLNTDVDADGLAGTPDERCDGCGEDL